MAREVFITAKTDQGNRKKNEDNFMIDTKVAYLEEEKEKQVEHKIFSYVYDLHAVAVCDGIGGTEYGEVATVCALSTLEKCLKEYQKAGEQKELDEWLEEVLNRINEQVVRTGEIFGASMATTLSLLIWKGNKYGVANIGDSPIYRFRNGERKKLSIDHTMAEWKRGQGKEYDLQEEHTLIHYIGKKGVKGSKMAHIEFGTLQDQDRFFLCSDGIGKELGEKEIDRCLNGDVELSYLWKQLKETKMQDNCTGVLIDFGDTKTELLDLEIGQCETGEEYDKLWNENKESFPSWESYITKKVNECGEKKKDLAEQMGVDAKTLRTALKQIPAKRDTVIALGIALGQTIEQINYMLDHLTNYHTLYSKNAHDAIWIYLVEQKKWDKSKNISILEQYKQYEEKFQELYCGYCEERKDLMGYNTPNMFSILQEKESFEDAMMDLIPSLEDGYQNLISYLEYIMKSESNWVSNFYYREDAINKAQIYYRNLQALKEEHKIPSREFLIVLCLQLELASDDIGKILTYAGMIPLYSKNLLEGKILYYLEELYNEHPSAFWSYRRMEEELYEKDAMEENQIVEYIYEKIEQEEALKNSQEWQKMKKLI